METVKEVKEGVMAAEAEEEAGTEAAEEGATAAATEEGGEGDEGEGKDAAEEVGTVAEEGEEEVTVGEEGDAAAHRLLGSEQKNRVKSEKKTLSTKKNHKNRKKTRKKIHQCLQRGKREQLLLRKQQPLPLLLLVLPVASGGLEGWPTMTTTSF